MEYILGWNQVQSYSWKVLALQRMTCTERVDGKVPQVHLIMWLQNIKVVNSNADFRIASLPPA